jgi:photosystem II stability/assembly factor-like uncharacterized protein
VKLPGIVAAATIVLAACTTTTTVALHPASPPATAATPGASPSSSPLLTPNPTAVPLTRSDHLISMRMTSLSVIWAATPSRVLRSTDGGRHWTDVTPPNRPGSWAAFFAGDDLAAWAVRSDYNVKTFDVLRTVDGGRTWRRSSGTLEGGSATNITFVDRFHGWMTDLVGAAAGSEAVAILRTVDGGSTWSVAAESGSPSTGQPGPSGISFGCDKGMAAFGTPNVGLLPEECAGGPQGVYRTTDGGFHWTHTTFPAMGSATYMGSIGAPTFLTATEVIIDGGYYNGAPLNALIASHDGGATWHVNKLPGTGTVDFESALSGWQLNATVVATADAGGTWHAQGIAPLPFNGTDMTLQYLGAGIAIAFRMYGGAAYRTDDGARSWRPIAPSGLTTS